MMRHSQSLKELRLSFSFYKRLCFEEQSLPIVEERPYSFKVHLLDESPRLIQKRLLRKIQRPRSRQTSSSKQAVCYLKRHDDSSDVLKSLLLDVAPDVLHLSRLVHKRAQEVREILSVGFVREIPSPVHPSLYRIRLGNTVRDAQVRFEVTPYPILRTTTCHVWVQPPHLVDMPLRLRTKDVTSLLVTPADALDVFCLSSYATTAEEVLCIGQEMFDTATERIQRLTAFVLQLERDLLTLMRHHLQEETVQHYRQAFDSLRG